MKTTEKPGRQRKPYWEMTTEERSAATAEFDKEFSIAGFGPPPPDALARWERAKRKRGHSCCGG
jgi:hypothetical protein